MLKHYIIQKLIIVVVIVTAYTIFAAPGQKIIPKDNPMAKFAKIAKIDEFNDAVSDNEKNNPKPKRGGQIVVRIPSEPRTLNIITSTDATSQYILGYIYDSLITRDSETFEYMPWLAWCWEVQDMIKLKDGKILEGRITSESADSIKFSTGAKKITYGKTEIKSYDIKSGEVILKNGNTVKGTIKDIFYTIEMECLGEPEKEFKIADLDTWIDETTVKKRSRPFFMKNVVYTFYLRDGIKWHDGKPITTDDIIFSYETTMNKFVDDASLRNYYQDIEKVEAPQKDIVKFSFRRPYFQSLDFCGMIYIIPKHKFDVDKFKGDPEGFGKYFNEHEIGNAPFGNGAYKFVKWEKGKQIVLEANRDYWACNAGFPYWDKEQPYLDKIIYTVINNKTAALKELQNGVVDADFDIQTDIWLLEATNSKEFKNKFVRAKNVTPQYTYIGWNEDRPFFKDKLVRQAMSHAVPTQKIITDLYKGLARIVTGPFFTMGPIYDQSIEPYEYNIETAKSLLRKARWLDRDGDGILDKDGVKFQFEYLIHNALDIHQKTADIVKESIEKTGVKMDIRIIDWAIFGKMVSDRQFDAVRFAWATNIDDDPYQNFHSSQIERGGSNFVGWSNQRADEIMEMGREIFDPEKRWSLYKEFHKLVYDEQPYTFLFSPNELFFYNKKFRNVKFYVVRPGYNFSEWYIDEKNK